MFLGSEFDPVFGLVWVRPSGFKMFFGLEVDSGFGLVQILRVQNLVRPQVGLA